MVLLIDNYDSFTHNLAHGLLAAGARRVVVRRPEQLDFAAWSDHPPLAVVISPGPGSPAEAAASTAVVHRCGHRIPLLGVCLGHQCLGSACGGRVVRAPAVRHGMTSPIFHTETGLFSGVPMPFDAMRYHSLVVDRPSLPDGMTVTAWTADGVVMGLARRDAPQWSVQFHPESFLTPWGPHILSNFISLANGLGHGRRA